MWGVQHQADGDILLSPYLQNAGEKIWVEMWPVEAANVNNQLDELVADVGRHEGVI